MIHILETDTFHRIRARRVKPVYGALCGNGMAPTAINDKYFTSVVDNVTCVQCLAVLTGWTMKSF